MSLSGHRQLSRGVISSHLLQGRCPPDDKAVFRVLAVKAVIAAAASEKKFRLAITDVPENETGGGKFNHGLIIYKDDAILPQKNDIVDFGGSENSMVEIGGRQIWVVREYRILGVLPTSPPSTPSSGASGKNFDSPPRPPSKRASSDLPVTPSSTPAATVGREVKRSLFSGSSASSSSSVPPTTKATHKIKDLNPYQNKYTILARVTNKGELKEISSSRWQGTVFNVTLQDDSGDIRVTGFNEFAKKFQPVFEEGKAYYVSHAQVKSIRDQKYNTTSHNYELSLNQNTVVCECRSKCQLPKVIYKFTKIADIAQKIEKDLVDILAVVVKVQDVKEVTTKAGRQVKKRDLTLLDQSEQEINLTLWAEKADSFAAVNRVVAFKAATVSDFNGKSLSLSFAGSLQADPDIAEAKLLQQWFERRGGDQFQQRPSFGGEHSENFVTIGDIKLDFKEAGPGQTKYYNVDAYLSVIHNEDSLAYKACPTEGCSKKLVEESSRGTYYCNKCGSRTSTFDLRYMLRGVLVDLTDYTYFTAFDQAGVGIMCIGAADLEQLKERDPPAYRSHLSEAKYTRYKFRLSCKRETYNGEPRLKFTVVTASRINQGEQEHVERIRRQLDELKMA